MGFYACRYYVTFRCNERCGYCNVWRNARYQNAVELPIERAKERIRQLYDSGVRYLDFTGGEPTLYAGLPEVLRFARALGIKTEVTSNGIASAQILEALLPWVDKLNISLDTLDREAYRRIRGVDGLERVKATIARISGRRTVKLMTVVTEDNIGELDALLQFAQAHAADMYFSPAFAYFTQAKRRENRRFIRALIERFYEPHCMVNLHFMKVFAAASDWRPRCSANRQTLTIAPDGGVMLPCYHQLAETLPWEGPLRDTTESASFRDYAQSAGRRECCVDCRAIPYFGICFSHRLDRFFLWQSYSERYHRLKRMYIDRLSKRGKSGETGELSQRLEVLDRLIASLDDGAAAEDDNSGFYAVRKSGGWLTARIYRAPLTPEQYARDCAQPDCWTLENTPHYLYDLFYDALYADLQKAYETGRLDEETYHEIFSAAAMVQLRWWTYYIGAYMNTAAFYDGEDDRKWLCAAILRLGSLAAQSACGSRAVDALQLLTMALGMTDRPPQTWETARRIALIHQRMRALMANRK